jgi:putative transferase (TIGR04331 family)
LDQSIHKETLFKNIRATALSEFWGTKYTDSLYLWEGAKHPLTLSEMEKITEETLGDLFIAPEGITMASQYCQQIYYKILPKLVMKLNEISEVNLPDTFWRTAFGYWLFRHISIAYEKYAYLSKIDVDKTSIKLLDKNSFYTPNNHYDYVYCFCNDFGVQQLVSHYYYLFKKSEFPSISMNFELIPAKINNDNASNIISFRKRIFDHGKYLVRKILKAPVLMLRKTITEVEPSIVLCGITYTDDVASALFSGSKGMIGPISLPPVSTGRSVNKDSRQQLLSIESDNDFEYFLVQSLYYCLPQMFLEQFRNCYDIFLKDIISKKFTHIVSEYWISDIPTSIYIAIAQNEGRRLICYEHGSGVVFDKTLLSWIDILASDRYMTVGWKTNDKKVIPGGFIGQDIKLYQFQQEKTNILYVARTNFPYLIQFDIYNAPYKGWINTLKRIQDFYDLLPESYRDYFILRPRKEDYVWNTEHTLEVKDKNIRVDTGIFSDIIKNARIIIIDHLSTGAAEILLRKIPCMIIQDEQHIHPLIEEIDEIFDELKRCGVMHNSAQSAVTHLTNIYEDVQQWWNSETVKAAVNKLISKTLAPPLKTIDYLLSCLNEDTN